MTTADEQGYNGWKNYETWATALWIDNDQGTYEEARRIVRAEIDRDEEGVALWRVVDALKEWAEELFIDPVTEDGPAGLHVDLLRAAWGEVDWYEIARNWIEELATDGAQ